MPAGYSPLPSSGPSLHDPDQELEDAFGSDTEDDAHLAHEATPLTRSTAPQASHNRKLTAGSHSLETSAIPGAYDFEREYDYPPPGSPPHPSTRALPNDYGNSNGLLPTVPVGPTTDYRLSFFRRTVGAILPIHYSRVPSEVPGRIRGGGVENDGVFANVMAKPQIARTIRAEDGSVYIMPEESQKETPPSYIDAQADAVPPYWETTVHAPVNLDPNADLIVEDLPTGSFWVFALTTFISFFFQFVGFLLTYLLHTSHAGKFGSRAGLGLTLIQFGFYSRLLDDDELEQPLPPAPSSDSVINPNPADVPIVGNITSRDWLAFLFMTLGWFLVLSSLVGFWRVKRWEATIRQPPPPRGPFTAEDIERDRSVRHNLQVIFGIPFDDDFDNVRRDESGNQVGIPSAQELDDTRLARNLRAAGLI